MPLLSLVGRAVLLSAVGSLPLVAQGTPSDSLPRELVEVLFGSIGGGRGAPWIRAGVLDSGLARSVVRDAVPLGVARLGNTQVSVARFPYTGETALDSIRVRLIREGYREPPSEIGPRPRGLGSSMSTASMGRASGLGIGLCGSRDFLGVTVSRSDRSSSVVVLSSQSEAGSYRFFCSAESRAEMARFDMMRNSPVPELPPPRGMMSGGGGGGGSPEDGGYQQSQLEGALSVARIQAHYDSLFLAAGWSVVERGTGANFATSVFELRTPERELWRAVLTIASAQYSGLADVSLQTRAARGR